MNKIPKKLLEFKNVQDVDMVLNTSIECVYVECASCSKLIQVFADGVMLSGTIIRSHFLMPAGKYFYLVHPKCREVFRSCPPVED